MCEKERLVAYVYGELEASDRERVDSHLKTCAGCREELAALRSVRVDLGSWTPPQPEFGFHIVHDRKPAWQARWVPAFGLAAAAVLLLAVASAIARIDVSFAADGVHVRTGGAQAPASVAAAVPAPPAPAPAAASNVSADEIRTLYAALEARVRELETAPRATAVQPAAMKPVRESDRVKLQQVLDLLAQSESKQRQELAFRIAQVFRDVDAQRIADLNRIQQGLLRIDAITTQEAASHRELANYIVASSRQQK